MPPAKPKKASNKNRLELEEFSEIYAGFVDIFGDPVEVMFRMMALPAAESLLSHGEWMALKPAELTPEVWAAKRPIVGISVEGRMKAAETLMSYKFPRLKALEAAPGPALAVNIHLDGVPLGERPQITIDAEPTLLLEDGLPE